ncbi:hypothetical protein REPUB_Repub03eG0149700 [Reevesia pubescens]
MRTEIAKSLQQLQESARKIAERQHECKLDVNVDEYVESTVRPFLMDVIYCWSKGETFAEVIQMTDIFEGSIIRSARRLDEFLNQVKVDQKFHSFFPYYCDTHALLLLFSIFGCGFLETHFRESLFNFISLSSSLFQCSTGRAIGLAIFDMS